VWWVAAEPAAQDRGDPPADGDRQQQHEQLVVDRQVQRPGCLGGLVGCVAGGVRCGVVGCLSGEESVHDALPSVLG
jgi:hypothetical protein